MIPLENQWRAAIEDASRSMIGKKQRLAQSTRERIAKHLRMIATMTDKGPWEITPADLDAIFTRLQGDVSTTAYYAYKTSVRTFYSWAASSGRVRRSPVEEWENGTDPRAIPIPHGWQLPLTRWADYLRAASRSEKTIQSYTWKVAQFARETGASTPADAGPRDLESWMSRHTWERETYRQAHTSLKRFYAWAVPLYADSDPTRDLPAPLVSFPAPRPVTEAEYAEALDGAGDPRVSLMIELAGSLGMRRGEVARASTRDVTTDSRGNPWLIIHGKGSKVRSVPLPLWIYDQITAMPPGYLFPGQIDQTNGHGGHLSDRYVGKLVRAHLPQDKTMHKLRHRFATQAYASSHDLMAVQQLLGHSSPAITQRYIQISEDNLITAMMGTPRPGIMGELDRKEESR